MYKECIVSLWIPFCFVTFGEARNKLSCTAQDVSNGRTPTSSDSNSDGDADVGFCGRGKHVEKDTGWSWIFFLYLI